MSGQFCNLSTYQIVMCSKYAYCLNVWMWGSYWDYVLASDQSKNNIRFRSFHTRYQILLCSFFEWCWLWGGSYSDYVLPSDQSKNNIRSFYIRYQILLCLLFEWYWLWGGSYWDYVPPSDQSRMIGGCGLRDQRCPQGVLTPPQHLHLTPTFKFLALNFWPSGFFP